jgi:hypothetical protein
MTKSRGGFVQDGCLRFMGLDVPVYDRWSKIAVVIIGVTFVTVPLVPFIGEATSILANWLGTLYLALLLLANLMLACFARRISFAHRSFQLENLFASYRAGHPSELDDTLVDSTGDGHTAQTGLRIFDLMILIAEAAGAIVLVRAFLSDTHSLPGVDRYWFSHQWELVSSSLLVWELLFSSLLVLIALTLGFSMRWIGRLRRPFRFLFQSPGAIACFLASAIVLTAAYHLTVNYTSERLHLEMQNVFWRLEYWHAMLALPPVAIGLLIVSVWNLLILSGRWEAEPTWIDRSGRLLGVCWIGWAAINTIVLPGTDLIQYFRIYGF